MIKEIILKYYLSIYAIRVKDYKSNKLASISAFVFLTFTLYIILYTILILIKRIFEIQLINLKSFGINGVITSSIICYIIIYGIFKINHTNNILKEYNITKKNINYSIFFFILFIFIFFLTLLW